MGTARILILAIFLFTTDVCFSAPKKYEPTGGFLPSPSSFFPHSGDQVAMESKSINQTDIQERSNDKADITAEASNSIDDRQQEPRFGFLTYGTTAVQNTGSTGLNGLNGQLKLDLGGVVLGAIIGFGAVFILPKILHVFSSGHESMGYGGSGGGYGYRSDDEKKASLMDILSRVDETLAQYNIDSSSCMQRAVCSYVKQASEKVNDGTANNIDAVVDSAAGNSMVNFMLDGTSIKQAVEMGRSGGNCGATYARCPFTKESVFAALKGLMADLK
ncbi:uncharacterized protein [Periplaneta americana]|uniref:uncharacterized protein n=1 Tax=Periplaneta americana TaxID=6978 RepID=UPI0037E80F07